MKNYFKNLAFYFPSGKIWASKNSREKYIGKFIYALSQQFYKTDMTIEDFFVKYSPYLADNYWLNLWEKVLGIPDDVFFLSTDLEQRRQFILEKLYIRKVYNIDNYYRLADILGLDINILIADAGSSILPFTLPMSLLVSSTEIPWRVIIEFQGNLNSSLPKTLPFTLKSDLENDSVFRKLCDKIKPVDTIFYYRNV